MVLAVLVGLVGVSVGAPLTQVGGGLASMDLAMTVFDQHSAQSADTSKNYVIFAFDNESCVGDKAAKCADLESALNDVQTVSLREGDNQKYQEHLRFGKANKDDFPDHKKDFDKAKVPLPAILFWPAGHSRPSCKFDSANPTPQIVTDWLIAKLKDEEDDDLLEFDEGSVDVTETAPASASADQQNVCQADAPHDGTAATATCGDAKEDTQGLMQLEKTAQIWDTKSGEMKYIGPANNSPKHLVVEPPLDIMTVDSYGYEELTKQGKYIALYFQAPWCQYCGCLDSVWGGVAGHLVASEKQPDLIVAKVDGDASPELRSLFNVTVYPSFVLVDKEAQKSLGSYYGPRKTLQLSSWIQDAIIAAENPIVKHQFKVSDGETEGEQTLASLEASVGLTGNDFDECVESDEAKFTAPGVALLVHYSSATNAVHALEMDQETLSTKIVPTKPTVVDFMVSWCPHCQKLNPVWDSISTEFATSDVSVGKIDLERSPAVKADFGIHRFPTIMYFEAGKPMKIEEGHRYTGQRDAEHIRQWIQEMKAH